MVTGETCLQGVLFSAPTWLRVSVGKMCFSLQVCCGGLVVLRLEDERKVF